MGTGSPCLPRSTPTSGAGRCAGRQEDDAVLDAVRAGAGASGGRRSSRPRHCRERWMSIRYSALCAARRSAASCGAEDVLRDWLYHLAACRRGHGRSGRALPDGLPPTRVRGGRQSADIVLIYPDHLELLDYKTDRRKTPADFVRAYRAQLELYARAIDKRFAPRRVTYKGIYSLELGELIEV